MLNNGKSLSSFPRRLNASSASLQQMIDEAVNDEGIPVLTSRPSIPRGMFSTEMPIIRRGSSEDLVAILDMALDIVQGDGDAAPDFLTRGRRRTTAARPFANNTHENNSNHSAKESSSEQ
jgi:hypothetical protein